MPFALGLLWVCRDAALNSRAHQVLGVVKAFYASQSDLMLLVVDPGLLLSPLKYEPPARPSGATASDEIAADPLYPHLYGPLNTSAILKALDLARFYGTRVHPDTCRCVAPLPSGAISHADAHPTRR